MRSAKLEVLLIALAQLTCHQVILTAPPGSTLTLLANPEFIPANGGVSVISALVSEPAGTPVPDGTVVQFFTNLGRIDEQGRTNDGVARVNLVSDARSGTATVRAFSGGASTGAAPGPSPSPGQPGGGSGASGSVTVAIGSALPARVQVTADPVRVTTDRQSRIRAFLFDTNGNAVASVPVIFTVEQPAGAAPSERMRSGGTPIFTDNNGVAEDLLEIGHAPSSPAKTVTIRATPAGNAAISATVAVTIN